MTPTTRHTLTRSDLARARRRLVAAVCLVPLGLTAGCSDDDTTANAGAPAPSSADGSASATGELVALTVDAPGTTAQAAVYLGASEGDFADVGLDVTVNPHTAADSPLVGLMAGEFPIVWTSAADFLVAKEKGLPIQILADSDLGQPGTTEVLVTEDSPIQELTDFEGTSIGIPGPTSSCAVTIPARLSDAGVDPSTVKLTPVALPDQGTALERGVVDAVCSPDPFKSIIKSQVPSRTMMDTFTGDYIDTLVGVYATTADWADQNPELVTKFREGLEATNMRLNGDQDALRLAIPTFTMVDPSLAETMALPRYAEDVTDEAPVSALLAMMVDAGLVQSDELSDDLFAG